MVSLLLLWTARATPAAPLPAAPRECSTRARARDAGSAIRRGAAARRWQRSGRAAASRREERGASAEQSPACSRAERGRSYPSSIASEQRWLHRQIRQGCRAEPDPLLVLGPGARVGVARPRPRDDGPARKRVIALVAAESDADLGVLSRPPLALARDG